MLFRSPLSDQEPQFGKLQVAIDLLGSDDPPDYFFWLDCDALVTNRSISLEELERDRALAIEGSRWFAMRTPLFDTRGNFWLMRVRGEDDGENDQITCSSCADLFFHMQDKGSVATDICSIMMMIAKPRCCKSCSSFWAIPLGILLGWKDLLETYQLHAAHFVVAEEVSGINSGIFLVKGADVGDREVSWRVLFGGDGEVPPKTLG